MTKHVRTRSVLRPKLQDVPAIPPPPAKSNSFAVRWLTAVVLIHLAIGCYYSGSMFFSHFADAVSIWAANDQTVYMQPGDHFAQLNRFTMVGHNLVRGRSLYYQGFQYNVSNDAPEFTEGWIWFPFSALGGLLAILFGDAAAVNLLVLLSYPFSGLSTFLLVRRLTGRCAPALLASILVSTLVFRTGFLYGELIFGVEYGLFPLALWAFECFLEKRDVTWAGIFGGVALCCVTANFQFAYFFFVFGAPYFVAGFWKVFRSADRQPSRAWMWIPVSLVPAGLYMLYVRHLVQRSWRAAQTITVEQLWHPLPSFSNLYTVLNGNEKNLFIGIPLLLFCAIVAIWGLFRLVEASTADQKRIWWTLGPAFVVSYLFCFGPSLDRGLRIPVYTAFFNYFPGASATRTPGRIMSVTGVFFAVLFGLALAFLWREWVSKRGRVLWGVVSTAGLAAIIVVQNGYVKPSMEILEPSNAAYESIRGTKGRVLALPFWVADDYHNCTYIYYAQKYDLKMFNGHSSLFTPEIRAVQERLFHISAVGEISETDWQWLRANDYQYIMAHDTEFQPKIDQDVLPRLLASPYLRFDGERDHVYKFAILNSPKIGGVEELTRILTARQDRRPVIYLSDWYIREAYPGRTPFRWMKGTRATLLVSRRSSAIQFSGKCPYNDLRVTVDGKPIDTRSSPLDSRGWTEVTAAIPRDSSAYATVELATSRIFRVPTDPRSFGCQISEVEARPAR